MYISASRNASIKYDPEFAVERSQRNVAQGLLRNTERLAQKLADPHVLTRTRIVRALPSSGKNFANFNVVNLLEDTEERYACLNLLLYGTQ